MVGKGCQPREKTPLSPWFQVETRNEQVELSILQGTHPNDGEPRTQGARFRDSLSDGPQGRERLSTGEKRGFPRPQGGDDGEGHLGAEIAVPPTW